MVAPNYWKYYDIVLVLLKVSNSLFSTTSTLLIQLYLYFWRNTGDVVCFSKNRLVLKLMLPEYKQYFLDSLMWKWTCKCLIQCTIMTNLVTCPCKLELLNYSRSQFVFVFVFFGVLNKFIFFAKIPLVFCLF